MSLRVLDQSAANEVDLYNGNLQLEESLALGIVEGSIQNDSQATKPYRLYQKGRDIIYSDGNQVHTLPRQPGWRLINIAANAEMTYSVGNGWDFSTI